MVRRLTRKGRTDRGRAAVQGRGHEAGDLRRLLELYQRWAHREFPAWGFPEFLKQLDRLSHKVRRPPRTLPPSPAAAATPRPARPGRA